MLALQAKSLARFLVDPPLIPLVCTPLALTDRASEYLVLCDTLARLTILSIDVFVLYRPASFLLLKAFSSFRRRYIRLVVSFSSSSSLSQHRRFRHFD